MKTILNYPEKSARSELYFGFGTFETLLPEVLSRYPQAFVFTDETVMSLYGERISSLLPDLPIWTMPAGEAHKQPETLLRLLEEMAKAGLRRGACLVAVGGGVVGDVGGLAAALYMRGIACVQVPTTLLSQVDSSVGGKTAVDFGQIKNLVGAFKQPDAVIVDPHFLRTLPMRELRCGLGEIVKHGALDGAIFDRLWQNRRLLTDLSFLESMIPANLSLKAHFVLADEQESGMRKMLNLGHTTAHAMELVEGKRSHGEYVLIGICYEAEIAKRVCDCDVEYLDRLKELAKLALGEGIAGGIPRAAEAAHCAKSDKKNVSERISLVVPVRKGRAECIELDYQKYVDLLGEAYGKI